MYLTSNYVASAQAAEQKAENEVDTAKENMDAALAAHNTTNSTNSTEPAKNAKELDDVIKSERKSNNGPSAGDTGSGVNPLAIFLMVAGAVAIIFMAFFTGGVSEVRGQAQVERQESSFEWQESQTL